MAARRPTLRRENEIRLLGLYDVDAMISCGKDNSFTVNIYLADSCKLISQRNELINIGQSLESKRYILLKISVYVYFTES